jgi:hypothetical protein
MEGVAIPAKERVTIFLEQGATSEDELLSVVEYKLGVP